MSVGPTEMALRFVVYVRRISPDQGDVASVLNRSSQSCTTPERNSGYRAHRSFIPGFCSRDATPRLLSSAPRPFLQSFLPPVAQAQRARSIAVAFPVVRSIAFPQAQERTTRGTGVHTRRSKHNGGPLNTGRSSREGPRGRLAHQRALLHRGGWCHVARVLVELQRLI